MNEHDLKHLIEATLLAAGRPVSSDRQPRTKNGHPPQITTGVARRYCSHWFADADIQR